MKKTLKLLSLLMVGLLLAVNLTGCGKKHSFTVYSEGDYISQELIDAFTEETGIKVNYVVGSRTPQPEQETLFADTSTQSAESAIQEALNDMNDGSDPYDDPYANMTLGEILQSTRDEAIAKAQEKAEKKGDASIGEVEYGAAVYDVVLTDGDTLGDLVSRDLLAPLDTSVVSNRKNIDAAYTKLDYDPNSRYTVTTMWEMLGLLWNTQLVGEQLTSWDSLWDSAYAGQIIMPERQRDCLSVALLSLDKYANATKEETLNAAFDKLEQQKPLVAEYSSQDAYILMENNKMAMYPCYSGDALEMMSENQNLAFLVPTGGTYRITFGYGVAADSMYSEEAMQFVNYMCDATNMATNSVYCKYPVTSQYAKDRLDEYWQTNPVAYPDESILEGTQILTTFSEENQALCDRRWDALMGTADSGKADTQEGAVSE